MKIILESEHLAINLNRIFTSENFQREFVFFFVVIGESIESCLTHS